VAPRLPKGGRRSSASATAAPPAKGSVLGDNREGIERAEQAQLVSIVSRLRQQAPKTAAAQAALDAEKAIEKEIYRIAKVAGFEKAEVKSYLEDLQPGKGREVEEREVRRVRRRRWLGLSVGESQPDLEARMPDEARDEQYWAQQGFAHGLTGGTAAVFPDGIPPRMDQVWARAVAAGSLEGKKIIADIAPKLTGGSAAVVAEPEVDVDAAAKKLASDPAFMARTSEEEGAAEGDEPGGDPEAAFEATPEELSAQSTRKAVQKVRAAGEPEGGEVV
jgi:hypothetical protein